MKTLPIRIVSAIVALILFSSVVLQFGAPGLKFICLFVSIIGALEVHRMLIKPFSLWFSKWLLVSANLIIFFSFTFNDALALPYVAILMVLVWSILLWIGRQSNDLEKIFRLQSYLLVSVFYTGILPACAGQITTLKNGQVWFFAMMAIVFAGDTFAFFFGILLGKEKMLPAISPNKTLMGSAGGIIGSALAAGVAGHWLTHIPIWTLVLMGAVTGLVAQHGDFFESLIKRISNTKDSGKIMPGHGGALDRLDGILFAAPIVLVVASILEGLY